MPSSHQTYSIIDGDSVTEIPGLDDTMSHVERTYPGARMVPETTAGKVPNAVRFLVSGPSRVIVVVPKGMAYRVVAR